MSRLKHDALSQSRQEWRQPQAFRIELTFAGLRVECSTCHGGGQVVWRYVASFSLPPPSASSAPSAATNSSAASSTAPPASLSSPLPPPST